MLRDHLVALVDRLLGKQTRGAETVEGDVSELSMVKQMA